MLRVSVIIPACNEQATLPAIVAAVIRAGCIHEIIIVDDGSTDDTARLGAGLAARHSGLVHFCRHPWNRGKGAAVRTGLACATGDVVLIQDADLEYNPADYARLLQPFGDPEVLAVFGSRILGAGDRRSSFAFYWGGRLLSLATNLLFGARLTDQPTGYKLVRAEVFRRLRLRSDGFGFCAEITGRLLRAGVTIWEVPISYCPRSMQEGKKIRWRHGWVALAILLRERFRRPVVLPVPRMPATAAPSSPSSIAPARSAQLHVG